MLRRILKKLPTSAPTATGVECESQSGETTEEFSDDQLSDIQNAAQQEWDSLQPSPYREVITSSLFKTVRVTP